MASSVQDRGGTAGVPQASTGARRRLLAQLPGVGVALLPRDRLPGVLARVRRAR
ncbi:MAG: hypothetical protein HY900_23105 [Deltaproteobacteria bacterium]|nr:hypothetical protein [Deltaproteobacteria bacterium]